MRLIQQQPTNNGVDKQRPTNNDQQTTGWTNNEQQTTTNEQQTTNNKQQTTAITVNSNIVDNDTSSRLFSVVVRKG